jgi:uncharacterized protein YxjI
MSTRFELQKKFWTVRASYVVRDSTGADAFRIHANLMGSKLTIEHADGKPVGEVQWVDEHVLDTLLTPTYRFLRGGTLAATVRRTRATFIGENHYDIEVAGGAPIAVDGNGMGYSYVLSRAGATIARVEVEVGLRDVFHLEIADGQDPVLPLAITLVLELVDHHGL